MEFDILSLRIVLLVSMLGITGIFDAKTRKIPDVLWLVFGGIGAILYLWDYDEMTPYHHITMILGGSIAMMMWRWKITGLADSFAVIAMTVILPVHYEFVMMPILVLVMTFFTVVFCMIIYNVSLNLSDTIRTKRWAFSNFESESKIRKAFAFLAIHKKRKQERFVISAEKHHSTESDTKSFVFLSSRNKVKTDNQLLQSNEMYVQSVPPLIAYMFDVAVFLLLPEILSLIID